MKFVREYNKFNIGKNRKEVIAKSVNFVLLVI